MSPEKYEALGKMESARTALRDAGWWYGESGRENKRGHQLEAAAMRYVAARILFETTS